MKTFSRALFCILGFVLCAFAAIGLEIRLDPGRAAHGFALSIGGGDAFAVDSVGL
jgi:hypothetical protein